MINGIKFIGSDGIGCGLRSNNPSAELTIEFTGTKFWLEGAVGPAYGIMNITIDETSDDINLVHFNVFNLSRGTEEDFAVYYEFSELPHATHLVTLRTFSGQITFSRLFYNVPAQQDILSNTNGLIRTTMSEIRNAAPGWGTNDDSIFTTNPNAICTFGFLGTKVYILSYERSATGKMNVSIDETFYRTIDTFLDVSSNTKVCSFSSPDLPYGHHALKVISADPNPKQTVILAFYYRPHTIYSELCNRTYEHISHPG